MRYVIFASVATLSVIVSIARSVLRAIDETDNDLHDW